MGKKYSKQFHDLNNTLGAIAINLEVANDEEFCKDIALESVQEALAEVKKLRDQIGELRELLDIEE